MKVRTGFVFWRAIALFVGTIALQTATAVLSTEIVGLCGERLIFDVEKVWSLPRVTRMNAASQKKFFVSYNQNDAAFAEWIAWVLEEAGQSAVIQAWGFGAGGNFVLDMQRAAAETDCTIAVLSEDALKSGFVQAEWEAAFVQDPTGKTRKLIPIRVADCKPSGLGAPIVYVDLVGVEKAEAKRRVLQAIAQGRNKPQQEPAFPNSAARNVDRVEPPFPIHTVHNLPIASLTFVGRNAELEAVRSQKLEVRSGF